MSAPVTLVFVHGWGFDAGFWDAVRSALSEVETLTVDLGFCGQAGGFDDLKAVPDGSCVAVGHSLGFLWLLRQKPVAWRKLVAINGFSRFTAADDFPCGLEPRMVRRMMDKVQASPEAVVSDFFQACAHTDQPGSLDPDALYRGLEWLMDWDGRAVLERAGTPLLVLAGNDDPIVPRALTEACFAGRPATEIHWRDGGHLLPVTAPAWCAERLREFARVS